MRNLLAGLLSASPCVPVFGQLLHVPLLPAAGDEDRQGIVRIVNPGGRAGELRVGVYDDAGRRRGTVSLSFEEGEQVKRFTSEDLENGNAAEGVAGVGKGTGDWRLKMVWRPRSGNCAAAVVVEGRLQLSCRGAIVPLVYARSRDGLLAALHDTVARDEDGAYRVHTFNHAHDRLRRSVLRLVNPSSTDATVAIRGVDDQGANGDRPVTVSLKRDAAVVLTARDLESRGLGNGAGRWRLTVTADRPIIVMNLVESATGHLTNISSQPRSETIPLFPAASENQHGLIRVVNRTAVRQRVSVRAFDDIGTERGSFAFSVGSGKAWHFTSNDLEDGNARKRIAGTGRGHGDWRLVISGEVETYAFMWTADGFMTSLHDTVNDAGTLHRVPAFGETSVLRIVNPSSHDTVVTVRGFGDDGGEGNGPVTFSLRADGARTITVQDLEAIGISGTQRLKVIAANPIILMSIARSDTGRIANLSTIPGDPKTVRIITEPLAGAFTYTQGDLPFQVHFDASVSTGDIVRYHWSFRDTNREHNRENVNATGRTPSFVFDHRGPNRWRPIGEYPYAPTYLVELTVFDRDGFSAFHDGYVTPTNTLMAAGQRDLVARINDAGGHRGKVAVLESLTTEPNDPHAVEMREILMEEGVPETQTVIPLIARSVLRQNEGSWVDGFLAQQNHATLRAETLVVNMSILSVFRPGDAERIAEQNMVWTTGTGNTINRPCITDRDFWHLPNWRACGWDTDRYHAMLAALRTGKAIIATAATRNGDGTVSPEQYVYKCGDTMESCFAVPHVFYASEATARLSAAVYHLFQTYEDADDVVHALKSCTEDVGEPGVDREFGQGLVDFRCAEAMLPVVER